VTEEEPGQGQDSAPAGDRVGRLEARQDSIEGKVDQILGILGGSKAGGESAHAPEGTGGGNVAAEIRAQLDERAARQAEADKQKAAGDRIGALEARVSELAEKPPQPVTRRVEKLMGWS
jgi:hypothetical protein